MLESRRQNAPTRSLWRWSRRSATKGRPAIAWCAISISKGASIEFSKRRQAPYGAISLVIARKGRSFLAKIIFVALQNFVGVASLRNSLRA